MFPVPRIQPLLESHIDLVLEEVGGRRAHPDSDRRLLGEQNADYRLGSTIIELKLLEEEGFEKPERRQKIALLFDAVDEDRPVVIIDPKRLSSEGLTAYKKAIQGPIQTAVRSARKQLKQSRIEDPEIETTVLLVINNGFTGLSHEELLDITAYRAKHDTNEIDSVIVAGCYLYGDGFDTVSLWRMDYKQIRVGAEFREFEILREAWQALGGRHMAEFAMGKHGLHAAKAAESDIVFDLGEKTYVKPATPFGKQSEFFGRRRPRLNHLHLNDVRGIAITVPSITATEFRRIAGAIPDDPFLVSFDAWEEHFRDALAMSTPLKPVIPIAVSRGSYEAWKRRNGNLPGSMGLRSLANDVFAKRVNSLCSAAVEMCEGTPPPRRYIAVQTEVIGQDARNDISHIAIIESADPDPRIEPILRNARIPFAHALALGAAHAIRLEIPRLCWREDLQYAWT